VLLRGENIKKLWISGSLGMRGCKDGTKSTKFDGQIDDRGKQNRENHQVLDQGDHSRSTQATGIGIGCQNEERDHQRYVKGDTKDVDIERNTQRRKGNLDTEHL